MVFIVKDQTKTGSMFGSGEKSKGTSYSCGSCGINKGLQNNISPEKYELKVCFYFGMHTSQYIPIIW
jgi:hypothetical protein